MFRRDSNSPRPTTCYAGLSVQQIRDLHEAEFMKAFSVDKRRLVATLSRQYHELRRKMRRLAPVHHLLEDVGAGRKVGAA